MTKSPTGIIPQEFNAPQQLPEVKAFLKAFPCAFEDKRELLFGWARNVGLRLAQRDYDALID